MTSFPLYAEVYKIGNRVYRRNAYKRNAPPDLVETGDTPDVYADDFDDDAPCEVEGTPVKRERQLPDEAEPPTEPSRKVCESDPRVTYEGGKYMAEALPDIRVSTEIVFPHCGRPISRPDSQPVNRALTMITSLGKIYVPAAFHGRLVGLRGTTRRELEESTECRLTIPRKGQKGNVEIKSFVGLENVQRCLDRIELLIAEARRTAPLTHFVAIPCGSAGIIQAFEMFKEAVMSNERIPEESRNPDLFTMPIKLHITVCVLWLFDEEEEKKAADVINGCHEEIVATLPKVPFEVEVNGVETWEDDPTNVRVIYGGIQSEPLQNMCDVIRRQLVMAGMSPAKEKSISTLDSSVRMHMTLMKSTYADRDKPKSFDAKVILDEYKDYHFGTFNIEKICVCTINTVNDSTGFYKQCFEMSL